jgi:hypothetical protein
MTSDTRRYKSTEELAFANIGGDGPQSLPTDRYGTVSGEQLRIIQAQIDQAMKGAIADCRRPNPVSALGPLPTVTPAGAAPARSGPVGNGVRAVGRPATLDCSPPCSNVPKLLCKPIQHRGVGAPISRKLVVLPSRLHMLCLIPADVRQRPHDVAQSCAVDHSL